MDKFFENNRAKLFKSIEGDFAVAFFSGKAPVKGGDEDYPYSVDRNFYYFTGFASSETMFIASRSGGEENCSLYIKRDNGSLAKWVGANPTPEEAEEISGVKNIKYADEFENDFIDIIRSNSRIKAFLDLEEKAQTAAHTLARDLAKTVKEKFENIEINDISEITGDLRTIKDEYEIRLIRKAIDITCEGLRHMMKNARPNMMEYELEAYFDFILTKRGVRSKAFQTIAAAGERGTILHYSDNDGLAKDGDLILVDCGAQCDWYNGDITRTFPVNGKFTERQKTIYNIVLEGQKKVIAMMKPGQPYDELNEALKEHYFEELKKIGLVETREEVFKYYYHNVGHFLGAYTHDVGKAKGSELKAGMVITVEPGLYIEEYGIGIRIEDDVLITENGCEVLSADMIKTVDEIEKFMAENNG